VYVTDGTDVIWLGMSSEPSLTLPLLPPPAQLVGGGSYEWAVVTLPSKVRSGTVNPNFANFSIP